MKPLTVLAAVTTFAVGLVSATPGVCDKTELISEDGHCHSLEQPSLGKTGELEHRHTQKYADGVGEMVPGRPNARTVSQTLMQQHLDPESNSRRTNLLLIYFGQFIDHDIALIETTEGSPQEERVDIDVEDNDIATSKIPFVRSINGNPNGPREFNNINTGWFDLSNIYGDNEERSRRLRRLDGSGKLKTSQGVDGQEMLPFNSEVGVETAMDRGDNFMFGCGDRRCNEHAVLISLTLLFVREHNRLADEYARNVIGATDDQIFDNARLANVHQYQQIIFNEWLPTLLGPRTYRKFVPEYRGYNPKAKATGVLEFSTAAFRFGHSGISNQILREDKNHGFVKRHPISQVFFTTELFRKERFVVDHLLNGIRSTMHEEIDVQVVNGLRNHLFSSISPPHPPLDLAALNIQRSRDHGIGSINDFRSALGIPPVRDISGLSSDVGIVDTIRRLYGRDINEVDLWVAGLCEDKVGDSHLGETFSRSIGAHFAALRDGDRFFFENRDGPRSGLPIGRISLNDIITRNAQESFTWGLNAFSADAISFRPAGDEVEQDEFPLVEVAAGSAGFFVCAAAFIVVRNRRNTTTSKRSSRNVDEVLESHRVNNEKDDLATPIEDC